MNKTFKYSYLTLVYLFFYIPIAVVIVYSFNDVQHSLIWHHFTVQWYKKLLHDDALFTVVIHSLSIALLAASSATMIGTLAAVNFFRYKITGKNFLLGLLFILIIMPDIVMGTALLILYNGIHLPLGFWSLLLAHISFCIPYVIVTVYARIGTINRHIFEAAKNLGAKDSTIFKKIFVPLLWPAILAGWLLSFTLSLDDVVISYFVSGPSYEILPLKIYSMIRLGVKPEINALCSILLLTTLIIVLSSHALTRKRK